MHCRDVDASPLLVKPAFSTAALAAVPVATGAYARLPDAASTNSSSSSGGSSVVRTRQLIDLLVLQPAGQLVLFRGSAALVTVRLLLPHGHLQQLQDRLAAAAAFRQRWLQQQRQQREGSPAFGGSRRSSGMQDAELTAPTGEVCCSCHATTTRALICNMPVLRLHSWTAHGAHMPPHYIIANVAD